MRNTRGAFRGIFKGALRVKFRAKLRVNLEELGGKLRGAWTVGDERAVIKRKTVQKISTWSMHTTSSTSQALTSWATRA